jgi:ABC-2 type transport system ATP-binding protein
VLIVEGLRKSFKSKGRKVDALNGLDFQVKNGEIFGFLGPNGAGKSTTIKIIMDLIRADSGEVKIAGIASKDINARKRVGFMPENPQYVDTMTGMDLTLLTASMYNLNKKEAIKRGRDLLEEFELGAAANRAVRNYSKGMIQRLGFVSAIIHEPEVLILDEPMSGLDPVGRILFKNKLKELNKNGVTIFFSSHIIPDIEDICTKVLIINKGKKVRELNEVEIKYTTTVGFNIIVEKNIVIDGFETKMISEGLYKIFCEKDSFSSMFELLKGRDIDIVDIEPVKKHLEDMFVEITQTS